MTPLFRQLLLSGWPLAITAQAPQAQEANRLDWNGVAGLISTYGPQAVEAWRANEDVEIQPSTLPASRRSKAVETMLTDYAEVRSGYASWSDGLHWSEVGVSGGVATVALFAGPQAAITVPVILAGAVITTGLAIARESVDQSSLETARGLLSVYRSSIEAASEMTYSQFHAKLMEEGAEAARQQYADNVRLFKDIRVRAGSDPELQRIAVELMLDAAVATNLSMLDAIDQTNIDVSRLEDGLIDLSKEVRDMQIAVDRRLDIAEEAISAIQSNVENLNNEVDDLDRRVSSLESGQGVIVDFIFDQMPPDKKVKYLKSGQMDSRLNCPDDEPECDRAGLKDSLIARFKAEDDFQDVVRDIAEVTGALNDVNTIATNLGIEVPKEVGQAIGVANIAVLALSATNPLGAMAAISGLAGVFGGGGGDADARRHAALMNYLDRRFDAIDERLVEISENQIILMRAVASLSDRMDASFRRMDQTLARIEYEQIRLSSAVMKLIWQPWTSCYSVVGKALDRTDEGYYTRIDPNTYLFYSEADIKPVIQSLSGVSIVNCIETMDSQISSISNPGRFGNFTDMRLVVDSGSLDDPNPVALSPVLTTNPSVEIGPEASPAAPNEIPPPVETSPPVEWRNWLMQYEADVFRPAHERFVRFTNDELGGRAADAFVLLARPVMTTDDWRGALDASRASPLFCFEEGEPHREARHCALLKPPSLTGPVDQDIQAAALLKNPVLGDVVNEVTSWVLIMAQIADIRDVGADRWVYLSERADRLMAGESPADVIPTERPGRELIEKSIRVLDVAIASYAMQYGAMPASMAAKDFFTPDDGIDLAPDLSKNAYLARNTVQFILEQAYLSTTGKHRPPEETYRDAYEAASIDQEGRFLLLHALFGGRLPFGMTPRGDPALFVAGAAGGAVFVPLPPPDSFTSGRIEMPPRYAELLLSRERLVDRLYGYDMLKNLSREDREAIAATLVSWQPPLGEESPLP